MYCGKGRKAERGEEEMIKAAMLSIMLATVLSSTIPGMMVPTDTTVQNLNGSQQVIKTFTVAPDVDPQLLIEEPFELEGYLYSFADIVKDENRVDDSMQHTETVTVETSKKDLASILEKLEPTLEYDDGEYSGVLALDHTTIQTEAAGYATKSKTVTETKTIGPLDRNDMSYVPATTVKDGVTLNLSGVTWQVIGTDDVDGVLMPSTYQAVATYSGKSYYSMATGYISTANYTGEVRHTEVESITYRVTYIGVEVPASTEAPDGNTSDPSEQAPSGAGSLSDAAAAWARIWPYALEFGIALVLILLLLLLRRMHIRNRLERRSRGNEPTEYEIDDEDEEGSDL